MLFHQKRAGVQYTNYFTSNIIKMLRRMIIYCDKIIFYKLWMIHLRRKFC